MYHRLVLISSVLVVLIPFLVYLFAVPFSRPEKQKVKIVDLSQYVLGLSILLMMTGFTSYLKVELLEPIFIFVLTSLTLYLLREIYLKGFPRLAPLLTSSLIIYFLFVAVLFRFDSSHKLFVNPDPFGYASIAGLIKKHGSLVNGLTSIESYTGTRFSFTSNWDDPSQFAWNQSPWNIPDFTDKYGIANGMYLHFGGSHLFLALENYFPKVESFFVLWTVVTLLSVSLMLMLILDITLSSVRLIQYLPLQKKHLSSHHVNLSKSIDEKRLAMLLSPIMFFLFIHSAWGIPMIWEGFLNQYLSYVICLGVLAFTLREKLWAYNLKPPMLSVRRLRYWALVSCFALGLFFAYAQQLPWFLGSLMIGTLAASGETPKGWLRKRLLILSAALVSILLTILLVPMARAGLGYISSNSGGGGSTHLGFFSPSKGIGLEFWQRYQIVESLGERLQGIFAKSFWPNSGPDGTGYELVSQGYFVNTDSTQAFYIQVLVLLLLFFIIGIKHRFVGGSTLVLASVFHLALIVFYLYPRTGMRLKSETPVYFNDYIWMRLNAVSFAYLLIPLTFYLTLKIGPSCFSRKETSTHSNKTLSERSIIGVIIFVVVIAASSFGQLNRYSNSLNKYSVDAVVFRDCPGFLEEDNYYLSDAILPALGLTVCGETMQFMNDSFASTHTASTRKDIIYFVRDETGDTWSAKKIAQVAPGGIINSPCDLQCLMQNPAVSFLDNPLLLNEQP